MTDQIEVLNANVEAAQAALDKLLKIKKLLWDELPAAQTTLRVAEKRLREATKPDRSASRKAELAVLRKQITEATQTEGCSHV